MKFMLGFFWGYITCAVFVVIFIIIFYPEPVPIPYSEGKVIDLPEEITQATESDNLGAKVTSDTIFLYFKK